MNKRIITAMLASLPVLAFGQTAMDAFTLSQYDLRGTARFMSMGGAFGALGGDLSTLGQNPAGIGLFRKGEVGVTLDIDIMSSQSDTDGYTEKNNKTKAFVNNFGYVGAVQTGSDVMPWFQWGATYNRVASLNRRYSGANGDVAGSLSNYVAGYTTSEGWPTEALTGSDKNYFDAAGAPWMSILAYNSFMMNPVAPSTYNGMMKSGTYGESSFNVEEKGYVDEYNLNIGGNIMNTVYWGFGVGITDIDYKQSVYYTEDLYDASIPMQNPDGTVSDTQTATGDGGFGLDSYRHITGTGYNVKFGVIFRPINELRLGFAIHTPTWYDIQQKSVADVDYGYGYTQGEAKADYTGTPTDYRDYNMRSPWRLMFSAAGVIGTSGIISVDYEYRPYTSIHFSDTGGDGFLNQDVKDYYQSTSILRVGGEYRVTPSFSLRAGYAFETTPTTSEVRDSEIPVYTSGPADTGTLPSYRLDKTTQYITCGLGYRYKNFYADAAYVYKHRKSSWHSFTKQQYDANPDGTPAWRTYEGADPYDSEITQSNHNIVLSVGVRF